MGVECEACGGEGVVEGQYAIVADPDRPGDATEERIVRCLVCRGSGRMDAELAS